MRYLLLFTVTVFSMSCSQAQIKDLSDFQWENRLLIIYTISNSPSTLENQLVQIKKATKDFAARDLKVIILQIEKVKIWNSLASHQLTYDQITEDLNISADQSYQNLLIGKDGGVKLRQASPISNQELFNTIDAMPMRQREMRDGK
jgi:hypothetical protein